LSKNPDKPNALLIQHRAEFDVKFPETSQEFNDIVNLLEQLSEETVSTTGVSSS
jgi:hypothetical protein